jgi:hypothetical protein
MNKFVMSFILLSTVSFLGCNTGANKNGSDIEKEGTVTLEGKKLPANWSIEKTITVPKSDISIFSNRLGGNIIYLVNFILKADGQNFQINIIQSDSENDAKKVYNSLTSKKGSDYVKIKGSYVVEYVMHSSNNKDVMERVKKANDLLGL